MAECDVLCLKGHQNCALQTRWTPVPCRKNAMGLTDATFSTGSGYTFLVIYYIKYTVIYLLYVVIRVVELFSITATTTTTTTTKNVGRWCSVLMVVCTLCAHSEHRFPAPSSPRCNHAGWLGIKHQYFRHLPPNSAKILVTPLKGYSLALDRWCQRVPKGLGTKKTMDLHV